MGQKAPKTEKQKLQEEAASAADAKWVLDAMNVVEKIDGANPARLTRLGNAIRTVKARGPRTKKAE